DFHVTGVQTCALPIYIVVGSGELQNPADVLTNQQRDRLKKAAESDTTVYIVSPDEVNQTSITRPKQDGKITWHFTMENTRDVARSEERRVGKECSSEG